MPIEYAPTRLNLAPETCLDCRFLKEGWRNTEMGVRVKIHWCILKLSWERGEEPCIAGIRKDD